MKDCTTPLEFLTHSLPLIRARPSTVKITTTYHSPSSTFTKTTKPPTAAKEGSTVTQPPAAAVATLTLKCYDPVSGALIKFRTNKVSDVGRLVGVLGRAGRVMGGLPDIVPTAAAAAAPDTTMKDAPPLDSPVAVVATPTSDVPKRIATPAIDRTGSPAPGGGPGGKGKKKKGKK